MEEEIKAKVDGIKYKINLREKTAKVDRYQDSSEEVVLIPKSINYNNVELKVTAIKAEAFRNSHVKTVIFDPDSQIKIIPTFSFHFSDIEKIALSPGITQIEQYGFDKCQNLIEIKIPPDSKLKQIENDAFQDAKIESLIIPSRLTKLDEGWNKYIKRLVNITVMPNNSSYIDINHEYLLGKSYPNNENFDVLTFASRRIIDAKIPNTVEIIGSYSFQCNTQIKCFILPPNVKQINKFAFDLCRSLEKFIIPSNSKLQYLGEGALNDTSITSLVIPNCVRFLDNDFFQSIQKLKIIQIDDDSQLYRIEYRMIRKPNTIIMIPADLSDKIIANEQPFESIMAEKDHLDIKIKDNSEQLNSYIIQKNETVFELKKKIQDKIGVFLDQIELKTSKHCFKNEEIVSNYVISNSKQQIDMIIKDNKTINVHFITDEGKKFSLNLTPYYLIKHVIEKIAQYLQVKIRQIKLFYGTELLKDSYSMHQYWIHDGSTINVTMKKIQPGSFQIFIQFYDTRSLALDVLPTDNFEDIALKIEIELNQPKENLRLAIEGNIVYPKDADSTLEEKGVKANSRIYALYTHI